MRSCSIRPLAKYSQIAESLFLYQAVPHLRAFAIVKHFSETFFALIFYIQLF